jgi:hypothetical protein
MMMKEKKRKEGMQKIKAYARPSHNPNDSDGQQQRERDREEEREEERERVCVLFLFMEFTAQGGAIQVHLITPEAYKEKNSKFL